MEIPVEDILLSLISSEDKNRIPEDIASKLTTALSDKINEVISEQGLLRTTKDKLERVYKQCKQKYINIKTSYDGQSDHLKTLTATHTNLEVQLRANTDELGSVWQQCTQLETEAAKLRQERQLAVEERDVATAKLTRSGSDLVISREEIQQLQEQLQRQTDGKYEAQAKLGDIESRMHQLDNKEKQIEQERAIFKTQVVALKEQLTDRTNELLIMRRDSSGHSVLVESHLSTLQSEHLTLQQQHTALVDQYTELLECCTRSQTNGKEAQQIAEQRLDAVQLERDTQHKFAEMLQIDAEVKAKQIDELERTLSETVAKLDNVVKSYDEMEVQMKREHLDYDQSIGKKTECIDLLRKELRQLEETRLTEVVVDEVFQRAAQSSKILCKITKNMSLGEIYNVYVQTAMQLIDERDETHRLRAYIDRLTEEAEEKGPLMQGAMATFDQLTVAHADLTQEMERMREQLREHAECADLKGQLRDLGRQVCKLLHVGAQQDLISKELVTFDSVEELQQNNQRLLSVVRDLTDKQRLIGDTKQLEQKLKRVSDTNTDLLEHQQRQESLIRMLTEQRDRYKMLCEQRIFVATDKPDITEDSEQPPPKGDKLLQLEKQLEQITTEHDIYRKEKSVNEQIFIDTSERLRHENQQLIGKNALQAAALDTTERHLVAAKRSLDNLRNQVAVLEERLEIHASVQVKLENSVMQHKDTLYESMIKLSKCEVALGVSQKDVTFLKDANERLLKERETFRSECQSLKVLQGNLTVVKATLERTYAESHLNIEAELCKQRKEYVELQQKLMDDQSNTKILSEDLQAKADTAKQSVQEERLVSKKLRSDLAQVRSELKTKTEQLLTVAQQSNSSELLLSRQLELEAVKHSLDAAKLSLQQQADNADKANERLNLLTETYAQYRADTEATIDGLNCECAALREHNADDKQSNLTNQRLKTVLDQLSAQEAELIKSRQSVEEMSDKYQQLLKQQSDDLIHGTSLKSSLESVRDKLNKLQSEHFKLLRDDVDLKKDQAGIVKVNLELQRKSEELTAQNMQLQEEFLNMSNVSLNQSVADEEAKDASSPLLKNIQYVKQKMGVVLSKLDVLTSENARLKLDLDVAQKHLMDAQQALADERQKSKKDAAAKTMPNEVLTQIETLNALTDSNRILRTERDGQLVQIKELELKLTELQKDMELLNGVKQRCDALQSENTTLRGEATRWRQRANTLIEKTNRTSPEDWKKLQTERETLAKQLTMERANIVRLNDDLAAANQDKDKLEETVKALYSATEDLAVIKTDFESLNVANNQLNTEHIAVVKDLTNKNSQLMDLRSQIVQLRKIAKKYKQQYESTLQTTSKATSESTEQQIAKLRDELRKQTEDADAAIAQLTTKNVDCLKELEKTKELMQVSKDRFTQVLKNVKDRMAALTEQKNRLEKAVAEMKPSGDHVGEAEMSDDLKMEKERHKSEVEELKARLSQLQRLLEDSASSGQTTGDNTIAVTPPTANIKPMAGHMASIRPLHPLHPLQQSRSSTGVPQVSVQPQQQQQQQQQVQVHTTVVASTSTASATIDSASLPSSSHEIAEQQPQLPTIRVLPSMVDTSSTTTASTTLAVVGVVSATAQQQPATIASALTVVASSSAAGSSTVVTTSGVKRIRNADGPSSDSAIVQQVQPLMKRSRLMMPLPREQQQRDDTEEMVEASTDDARDAGDVEYQVPTSSQRDHEDDAEPHEDAEDDDMENAHIMHLVVSDEEDDTAEAIAAENVQLTAAQSNDDDDRAVDGGGSSSNSTSSSSRTRKRSRTEAHSVEQQVDVIACRRDNVVVEEDDGDEAAVAAQEQVVDDGIVDDGNGDDANAMGAMGQQMEAISSSATATSSSDGGRPLQQQQQLLVLPEESADDGIVPSTPTLVLPRRSGVTSDGGVSSPHPHVPTVAPGRLFTFSSIDRAAAAAVGEQEVLPGGSNDQGEASTACGHDNQITERNVPSTPQLKDGGDSTQQVEGSEEAIVGGSSSAARTEDEGREAEATPIGISAGASATAIPRAIPTIGGGQQRRAMAAAARPVSSSGAPAPISWGVQGHVGPGRPSPRHPGRGLTLQRLRRNRGAMPPRGGYSRY